MTQDVIINFHGVGPRGPEREPGEHLYWLETELFETVIGRIAAEISKGRRIRITFDDGNASDLEIAAPILARHGLAAEFFVLAGRIGQPRSLDAEGIRALQAMGMSIGAHGADHVDWRRIDDAGAEREIDWARATIAEVTGRPVDRVAIPFGGYNGAVIRRLKRAGFERIYTSDGGTARSDALIQARTSARRDLDPGGIDRLVSGSLPLKQSLRRAVAMTVKQHV